MNNNNSSYFHRDNCRLCTSNEVEKVIDLPATPIGDHYIAASEIDKEQACYPLDVYFCHGCGHIQLLDVVNPELIYADYLYETSNSLGLVKHFDDYANDLIERWGLGKDSFIMDIGCNDGSILKAFQRKGLRVLGIEPASAIAEKNNQAGIETLNTFFSEQVAEQIRVDYGPVSLVTANNVMANIDDLDNFAAGIKTLLDKDGLFVFESGYLPDTIDNSVIDNIYHEHLSYFRVNPLIVFLERNGLELIDIQHSPTKGGSLRGVIQLKNGPRSINESVKQLSEKETQAGFDTVQRYKDFANRMQQVKEKLAEQLKQYNGGTIVGYGASVGVTTLNYYWELDKHLSMLLDDNSKRHGLYSPGHHLPVLSSDTLYEQDISALLILAWRYANPILERHKKYIDSERPVIIPLPDVVIK